MPIAPRRSRSLPRVPSGIFVDSLPRPRCARRAGACSNAAQRDRLAVDRVAAEQLVRALAGQHDLDVLARLAGDEVQRDERRVGDRVVEVPDDQRQGLHHLLGRHDLGDVLDADGCCGFGRDVDLAVALALEAGGEGQQVRVVPLGQRGDGGRVDAAGQERADRDVRPAHVLLDGVLERLGDLPVQLVRRPGRA